MEPKKVAVGVVIRPDGTVPFDEPHDPEVRRHILEHLVAQGHQVSAIGKGPHLKIHNWVPPADGPAH